ncbi:adaptin [Halodesulfurarchaeum formicicum]|uniref:Adaptin n=2 Tax=Halodesulfurarchaeum formicicum TaxID=1873524 RepID=A0A1J1AD98_9EURY|nr:adaptin [Halodesulfurarchaeum formicicum]
MAKKMEQEYGVARDRALQITNRVRKLVANPDIEALKETGLLNEEITNASIQDLIAELNEQDKRTIEGRWNALAKERGIYDIVGADALLYDPGQGGLDPDKELVSDDGESLTIQEAMITAWREEILIEAIPRGIRLGNTEFRTEDSSQMSLSQIEDGFDQEGLSEQLSRDLRSSQLEVDGDLLALKDVDFSLEAPRQDRVIAIAAARRHILEHCGASRDDILEALEPEKNYPLGIHGAQARSKGFEYEFRRRWWADLVAPGLRSLPDIREPAHDSGIWLSNEALTGGVESETTVETILNEGYVFELTHQTDDDQKTHLVTHFEPDRPSMTPLKGPPAFWFETVENEERFSVRLPEIEALHPVPYESLADPLAGAAFAAVRKQLEDDVASVDEELLRKMLTDVVADATSVDRREALRLAMITVKHRDGTRRFAVDATFALLADEPSALDRAALQALHDAATDEPAVLKEHVGDLAVYASQDSMCQAAATHGLMELAEADPASVLDAVPALEAAATAETEATQSYAVYALSCVAEAYPEEAFSAIAALIEVMQSENETTQTNALAALGKIASNYPDAAEPIVDELVTVLDADAKRVRNNAVGLLGDLAQAHPAVVIEYADRIAARLEDNNIQARVNASIALQRAGEADPAAIRAQQDQIEAALQDPSPEVRANVCSLIGNANVSVPIETLEEVAENDLDETVRDRAAWAISRLR